MTFKTQRNPGAGCLPLARSSALHALNSCFWSSRNLSGPSSHGAASPPSVHPGSAPRSPADPHPKSAGARPARAQVHGRSPLTCAGPAAAAAVAVVADPERWRGGAGASPGRPDFLAAAEPRLQGVEAARHLPAASRRAGAARPGVSRRCQRRLGAERGTESLSCPGPQEEEGVSQKSQVRKEDERG